MLHHCGGRDPPLAGPVPESGNTAAWVEMHLKVSRNLRALFAGHTSSLLESCAIGADREARAALLELNLEALEHLSTPPFGDGANRADVAQESCGRLMRRRRAPARWRCRCTVRSLGT
ncbi:unnamed protein product [Effrenium voratum]|uniref:Uncharacterized protein n=1 Tax=Effrenium voratum TaxID=2562239 RepID=A0AA36NHP0_9DINO|nr:unnamed protein product [Effrenium voratum]